jgi:hypothetical protein
MPGFILDMQGPELLFKLLRGSVDVASRGLPRIDENVSASLGSRNNHPGGGRAGINKDDYLLPIVRGAVPFLLRPAR